MFFRVRVQGPGFGICGLNFGLEMEGRPFYMSVFWFRTGVFSFFGSMVVSSFRILGLGSQDQEGGLGFQSRVWEQGFMSEAWALGGVFYARVLCRELWDEPPSKSRLPREWKR